MICVPSFGICNQERWERKAKRRLVKNAKAEAQSNVKNVTARELLKKTATNATVMVT
jgi:hypothetical protein